MEVILASCGNPDHFQNPDQPMYGCESDHRVIVNSLEEASVECKKFINRNSLVAVTGSAAMFMKTI